ncbi:MAG: hypothetical protein KGD63_08230 [Candidatus Lokiarchaeota archaeon]|nr:hypothetical protein [Candidatus Lokiarchaeota archaeon]
MWRKKKKERIPSDNYCILCGRYTNDKKFPKEDWTNYFFSCNNCKIVWCNGCMGQITQLGSKKTFKMGKKGGINCQQCGNQAFISKLPINLIFKQKKRDQNILDAPNYCTYCGETISKDAQFCHICSAKQNLD